MVGILIRSLIRLLVTVGVLVAVYLLLVKPLVDTTEDTLGQALSGIEKSVDDAFEEVGIDPPNLSGDSRSNAERMLACVQRVQPDATKMQRCAERFSN